MDASRIKQLMDEAAGSALDARRRIEKAVEIGMIPSWVLDACEQWERAALSYGAGIARRDLKSAAPAQQPVSAHVVH